MVIRSFMFSYEKIPHAQKAQKATFFIWDVFMCTKSTKSVRHQTSDFLPLSGFYAYKNAVAFICLCEFCAFYAKQAAFFLLMLFLAFKTVFFDSLMCVLCFLWVCFMCVFCAFLQKSIKPPSTIIYYTTLKRSDGLDCILHVFSWKYFS